MERFPMLWNGGPWGELITEKQGLYTCFSVRGGHLPEEQLWCGWAIGERGELRLGVLEPEGRGSLLCRRFSGSDTGHLGRILRGEVRPIGQEARVWHSAEAPETLFRAPWLQKRLQNIRGALTCCQGERRLLALPWDKRCPFPLTTLFCLGRLECIGGRYYVVYAFDPEDRPVAE